ncbi:FAD-dependent monooxygenase [Chromobacterium vaccinii]|uniref:FAD-dependent monooxygenase n=1 Tax=Chromobacterium vaccinii TaxID=1108595 RepID=UPI001E4B7D77|nr:FAD-dependent monooxygenase [Chromobacterium vaccinii]MCD4486701.1 FAD-dependent monooxygenase [Chromobacterium vaccinii]
MPHHHPTHYDVIIAGAGPVGLFLACEFRLFGLSVLILEQAADSRSPLKRLPFGMRGLSVPSVEALHRRGLLNELITETHASGAAKQAEASAHWMQQPRRAAGHFAGIPFYHDDIDASHWPFHLLGPADATMAVSLEDFETMMARRASAMGAEIVRGVSVDGYAASDAQVTVHASGQAFYGRWLIGCDGGRSAVRKAGGFEFAGTDPEFTGYTVDAVLAEPHALQPGRHYTPTGMYTYARPGVISMVEFDGGACHRQPITREHIQAVLRRVSGMNVTLTGLRLATTWTDRAYQATAYRQGRALLAGDAAHIHSPLGGQGLNLGIGDAINLGWKLAATIRGNAPAGLLDSYHQERHPVGARVLDWSRAQVALMRPTPSTRALEAVIRDLVATRDGATYFAGRVWGVSLRDDLAGEHPLTGRSLPDFEFEDGTKAGNLMRNGRGLLLDFNPAAPLQAWMERWQGRVDYAAANVKNSLGLHAVLVRPDGVVAWASDAPPDIEEIATPLAQWFGEPGDHR